MSTPNTTPLQDWNNINQGGYTYSSLAHTTENKMHLRYCLIDANINCNVTGHPQKVMEELGITYQHATPQSIGDQWWFWNCEGLPDILPDYLTELKIDPMECIGWGLNKEMAEKIFNKEL